MKFKLAVLAILILGLANSSYATALDNSPEFYRSLTNRLRTHSTFAIPSPQGDTEISYNITLAAPAAGYELPRTHKLDFDPNSPETYYVSFADRIFTADGSTLKIKDQVLPITCVFIDGQDNRASGNSSPLLPNLVLKVYLVANDFACEGPINRGFPSNGGREQTWDTYMFYFVKDPTIMLPQDSKLRYRWNEFETVLVDRP